MNNILKFIKYLLLFIVTILIVILWKLTFLLQLIIGLEGPIYLVLLKLSLILGVNFFVFFILVKILSEKGKVVNPKILALKLCVASVFISALVQYFFVDGLSENFQFKNKNFTHLNPILIHDDSPAYRISKIFMVYSFFLPKKHYLQEFSSYWINASLEASFVDSFRKLISENNIKNTCKMYLDNSLEKGSCIVDLEREMYSNHYFTFVGNVSVLCVGLLGSFLIREIMFNKYGKNNLFVNLKIMNDFTESSTMIAERLVKLITQDDQTIKFTMGYEMVRTSTLYRMERLASFFILGVVLNKTDDIIKLFKRIMSERKKDLLLEKNQSLNFEISRHDNLTDFILSLRKNGFSKEEIIKNGDEISRELEKKFNVNTVK